MTELKEQKGMTFWKPEAQGEQIEGTIISVDNSGKFGLQLVIQDANGEPVTTPAHAVLQSRLSKAKEGKKVRITFEGTEAPTVKGQSPTNLYKVELEE